MYIIYNIYYDSKVNNQIKNNKWCIHRQWRNLDGEQQKYLIQLTPPADIIPEIVRSIVIAQNITNAGIMFDDTFGKKVHIKRWIIIIRLNITKIIYDLITLNSTTLKNY